MSAAAAGAIAKLARDGDAERVAGALHQMQLDMDALSRVPSKPPVIRYRLRTCSIPVIVED